MPVMLREVSSAFRLTHPDSMRILIRPTDRVLLSFRPLRDEMETIRHGLMYRP